MTFRWHPWRCFRSSSTPVSSPETRPLSSLQSLYIVLTNDISNLTGSSCLFPPPTVSPVRYDLDACDIQEKYPDLFQVNLNIEVDPRDKPRTKSPPWEGFQTKGLNPKILFSSRDEQQEILSKFGTQRFCNKAILLVWCLQLSFSVDSSFLHFPQSFWSTGKPELPRQPGSSAFYDADSPQPAQTPEGSSATEPESPGSTDDDHADNFFQTLDWEGTVKHLLTPVNLNSVGKEILT